MKNATFKTKINNLKAFAYVVGFAGIATASVSLVTTASGFTSFLPQIWQTVLISSAVQFFLLALNIKFIEIWSSIQSLAKWIMPIILVFLLFISSSFSFVYMTETAYPKTVFLEDAERILDTTVFECDLDLNEALKNELSFATKSNNVVSDYLDSLERYSSGGDAISDFSTIASLLEGHKDLVDILYVIEGFSSETYNSETIDSLKKSIESKLSFLNSMIETNQNNINSYNKDNEGLNERLESIHDITNPVYIKLVAERDKNIEMAQKLMEDNKEYSDEISLLNTISGLIGNMEGNNTLRLQRSAALIREQLTASAFNSNDFKKSIEEIHKYLLDSNIPKDHDLVKNYDTFLREASLFAEIKTAQVITENEIDELQKRSMEVITNGVGDISDEEELANWKRYWHARIIALRNVLKSIPSETLANSDYSIKSRGSLLSKLDEMERLYLSELNSFEKAWTIIIGPHRYKMSVLFCLIFAVSFDLISLGAGIITFLYKEGLRKQYQTTVIKKFPKAG